MKVIFYSPQISPRLTYIIDFFSKQISNKAIIITTDITAFKNADAVKINYSATKISEQEVWIQPHALLFENSIQAQNAKCFEWEGLQAFFRTGGDMPFDIFAASFYLISRYEEYLPHEKDMYGRYAHTNSLAHKENFLHLPLVNVWIKAFCKKLHECFPSFIIHHSPYTFLPTYDIDIAYSYLYHPLIKNVAALAKDAFTFQKEKFWERFHVIGADEKDPFDTFSWLDELHKKYNLQPVYFFLLAAQRKGYDKNISPHSKAMQQLMRQHANKYSVGIHPSWQSGDAVGVLKQEISLLESITGKPVKQSRQHYIRMQLPQTYRLLVQNNIKEDYSMGYGSINGFRASVASSFYWYDLLNDKQATLLIKPFCYMEANSYFEQHYTALQAAHELQHYHDIVKSVNGELITIFHNHFLTEQKEWLPCRNMYEEFLGRVNYKQ